MEKLVKKTKEIIQKVKKKDYYEIILDKYKFESLLRTGIAVFIALCLSVSYVPNIIPPSSSYLIAIMVMSLVLSFSKYLNVVPMILPTVLVLIVFILIVSSALVACVTVSDVLYISIFTIYAFVVSGLFFVKEFTTTSSIANLLIAVAALLSLSFRPLVKNGITQTIPIDSTLDQLRSSWILPAMDILCQEQQNLVAERCALYEFLTNQTAFEASVPIPSDAPYFFGGQTVQISMDLIQESITVNIPGGAYMVGVLWSEKGTTNSLAVFRNILIIFCWIILITASSVLLPFIRRQGDMLFRLAVPGALTHILNMMKFNVETDSREDLFALKEACQHDWTALADGAAASILIFEPRLCEAPYEMIVPQMHQLLKSTDQLIQCSIALFNQHESTKTLDKDELERLNVVRSQLGTSLKLLTDTDPDQKELQRITDDLKETNDAEKGKIYLDQISYLQYRSKNVLQATIVWIEAYYFKAGYPVNQNTKMANLKKTLIPWLFVPFVPFKSMFEAVGIMLNPFHEHNLRVFFYCLKLTVGYLLLVCMTVYWDDYANFALKVDNIPIGAVFHGWHLSAYAFCWLPSLEGTVKKGVQRIFGTALGGFSAWIGLMFCSGSLDDSAPVNPYVLVVWILVTTLIAASFGTEPGVPAMSGKSQDHGYAGVYFSVTQALITLEAYWGIAGRDDLVANRVTANVVGVVMAILLSMVPPYQKGGDTTLAEEYLNALKEAFEQLTDFVQNYKKKEATTEKFLSTFLEKANLKKKVSFFLFKDANKLKNFPIMKVNEKLQSVLEDLALTHSIIQRIGQFCAILIKDYPDDFEKLVELIKSGQDEGNVSLHGEQHDISKVSFSYKLIEERLYLAKKTLEVIR